MIKMVYLLIIILSGFAIAITACNKPGIVAAGLKWDMEAATMNWNDSVNYCRNKRMRLPTKDELLRGFKSNDSELLKRKETFWSSNSYLGDTSFAEVVNFGSGDVYHYNKAYDYYVRCVTEP